MQKQILISTILFSFVLLAPVIVQADNDDYGDAPTERSTVSSIDGNMIGKANVRALTSSAEYCVENEQYDKAIKLSRLAIEKNTDDNEIHQVYAEALEGKLDGQVDRDPNLYFECVKQWLIVLRQEYGDEKLTSHGLGIPMLGKFYEDDDRVIPARKHLMHLVGFTPKVWETDAKYLKKVMEASSSNVSGKVVPKNQKTAKRDEAQY